MGSSTGATAAASPAGAAGEASAAGSRGALLSSSAITCATGLISDPPQIIEADIIDYDSNTGGGTASGKFVARVPKTVHAQLTTRAKVEGVSLNTLVLTFIAQGLGGAGVKVRAKSAG